VRGGRGRGRREGANESGREANIESGRGRENKREEGREQVCVLCTCVCVCRNYECLCSHPRPASHCQASHTLSAVSLPSPTPRHDVCTASHLPAHTAQGSSSHRICHLRSRNTTLSCWTARPWTYSQKSCRTASPLRPDAALHLRSTPPHRWGMRWAALSIVAA
jgi:hypothetical protein